MRQIGRARWLPIVLAAAVFIVPILPSARAFPGSGSARVVPFGALATPPVIYVPASAHAGGANGADWRTDLQIHNAGTAATTATIALLVRDAANPSPQTRTVPVAAGTSVRLPDVLLNTFAFTGAAALRVTSSSDRLVVTSRTYNLVGPGAAGLPQGSSFGQFVRGVSEETAIPYGQEGRLIQLTQRDASSGLDFRTNVGFVNLTASTLEIRIDLYRSDGTWLGARSGDETRLRAYEFRQLTEVMKPYGTIADGYAVLRTTTPGGRFLAFATVIDNHLSGDPVFVPAAVTSAAAAPTPTPTPTPTPPTGARPNLVLHQPAGWSECFSASSAAGCCNDTVCCVPSLSTFSSTYIQFFLANAGSAMLTGPVAFVLLIDGAVAGRAGWTNGTGLDWGYGLVLTWEFKGAVSPGAHSLQLAIDPDDEIPESNEGDNACNILATWGGEPLVTLPLSAGPLTADQLEAGAPIPLGGRVPRRALAAAGETWLPATAHASGLNGANWRTDLEIHNPGSTAASFALQLLPRDANNTTPAGELGFSLDPHKSVRYVDVLDSVFRFTGAAALRIVPTAGTVVATSRTYNLVGANPVGLPVGASFGQFVPGLPETAAISSTEEGRLIQLTQRDSGSGTEFRTNIGIVNTTGATVDVRLDFFRADGTWLGVKQGSDTRLPPFGFRQLSEAFAPWGAVADGYVVARPTTAGGRIFAFATVIDNHLSGDPIFIPAERMAASAIPTPGPTPTPTATPTPGAGVIAGPGGTTIALPPETASSGASVTLVAGDGTTLPKAGETLVSTVVKTSVDGTGVAIGNGTFTVTLPVTGAVSDPERLLLKVAVSTGRVYPVAGVYDSTKKTFTAELMKLWDGWTMGVVTNPGLIVTSTTTPGPASDVSTTGWVTPTDWETCEFRVVDDAHAASAAFKSGIPSGMKRACEHLRGAEFRSPQLWMDRSRNRKERVLHLVQGTGPNDPETSFSLSTGEEAEAFSIAGYTDAQMQSLGQVYFNWDGWTAVEQPNGWSYENITIHELLHAVQAGYDFRGKWWRSGETWRHSALGIMEGTATLVGQAFQSNPNGIYGGDIPVRLPDPPAKVDQPVLWPSGVQAYARQDFFAYVAKRWNGGSLRDLRWLFQHLSDQTDKQFGKSAEEYWTLYRKAMDIHYQSAFGISLPELYAEYARDRAYRHETPALLRAADSSLKKNSLDRSLFIDAPTFDPAAGTPLELKDIWPLAARAVTVPVSGAARAAKKLTMTLSLKGATLGRQGLRIFVYPEKDGVLEPGTDLELTDLSKPVEVPVGPETAMLTVLVLNGSVAPDLATVTFSSSSGPSITTGDFCNLAVGQALTVEGSGFGAVQGNSVFHFGGLTGNLARITSWSDTRITLVVPDPFAAEPGKTSDAGGAGVCRSSGSIGCSKSVSYVITRNGTFPTMDPVGYNYCKSHFYY